MMTIDEAQGLKDELELDIAELVQRFISATGLEIRAVVIEGRSDTKTHKWRMVAQVQVSLPDHE